MAVRYRKGLPDKDTGASHSTYALPFSGTWAVMNGGMTKETSHSWDVYTQRYAYDFLMLDEAGRSCAPSPADPTDPSSYYCYGHDVLAPADGTVVETHDGCPNAPMKLDGVAHIGGDDIRGNFVLIEHEGEEFSALCHLISDSLVVQVGQKVKRGDVIGKCGSSGCSSEPHIHFHVQKGRSFYSTPGIPIRFDNIKAHPIPNYATLDPRSLPEDAYKDFPPFLTRGLLVENA